MKIGITYNLKSDIENIRPEHLLAEDAFEEFDTEETIDSIASVLEKNGHSVFRLGWGRPAVKRLLEGNIDFVFNISEGFTGRNREAQIPAILEMLEIPHTGSDPLTLSLALDKVVAKQIAKQNNIVSPDYFVVYKKENVEKMPLRIKYPLFIKPAWEGSSKGIQQSSKANNKEDLEYYVRYLLDNYPNQPVLIEQYVQGEEFTVAVLGNEKPQILGIMRISPKIKDGTDFFYSIEVKRDWENLVAYECPAKISGALRSDLEKTALAAFKAFGARDVARVDFRVDKSGVAHFLEINPLPGLSPKYSDIVIMTRKLNWTYEGLIMAILNNAVNRYNFCEAHTSYNREKGEAE